MRSSHFLSARPARRHPAVAQPEPRCVLHLTVDTDSVTALRRLALQVCGAALVFMRIKAHGERMKVSLCIGASSAEALMTAIVRELGGAELGRLCAGTALPAQPRRGWQ